MSKLILVASFFFGVFGFKLYGVIDFMVVMPAAFLVLLLAVGAGVRVHSYIFVIFALFCILLIEYLAFNLETNIDNPMFIARTFRSFLSGLFLFVIFYTVLLRGRVRDRDIFLIICQVFLVASIIVLVQALYPPIQGVFAELWGFNKSQRYLRAFGLAAGYDSMGYLLSWFASFLLCYWFRFGGRLVFALIALVSLSVTFTSRSSMVMLLALSLISLLVSVKYLKFFSFKYHSIFLLMFILVTYVVYPIISASIIHQAGDTEIMGVAVSSRFATTDIEEAVSQHFYLPQDRYSLFFGTGVDPGVDPGYIVSIHHGGVISVVIYLLFYLTSYGWVLRNRRKANRDRSLYNDNRWVEIWRHAVLLLVLTIVFGNFKNMYFLTRGYHELFIILLAINVSLNRVRLSEDFRSKFNTRHN